MLSWRVGVGCLLCLVIIGYLLVEGRPADAEVGSTFRLPDYRWVVEEQQVIVGAEDLGLAESVSVDPAGVTFGPNGDLLLAASVPWHGTFILRSADQGHTWSQQGVVEARQLGLELGLEIGPVVESMGMTALASGRLVIICWHTDQIVVTDEPRPGDEYFLDTGHVRRFKRHATTAWGAYSDDLGKTWQAAPMELEPFKSADFRAGTQIFETEKGTLVSSFHGQLGEEELLQGMVSVGLIRSHDQGESWGDANPIVRAQPGSGLSYSETEIVPLADGRWLCMMRLDDFNMNGGWLCRSYSSDEGRSWSYPVRTRFRGGEPGAGRLPDGGIISVQTGPGWVLELVFTAANKIGHRWQGPAERGEPGGLLYEVSYDGGLTWGYWAPLYVTHRGSSEHTGTPYIIALDDNSVLAVYHRSSKEMIEKHGGRYGPRLIGASWLKKVPADSPEASHLEYPDWLPEQTSD